MDLSLGFLFCSIDLYFFVPVPYCLDDCGFVVEPEVRQVDSSSSILLSISIQIVKLFVLDLFTLLLLNLFICALFFLMALSIELVFLNFILFDYC